MADYNSYDDNSYDLEHGSSDIFDNREETEGAEPSKYTFASSGEILQDRLDNIGDKFEDIVEDIKDNKTPDISYDPNLPESLHRAVLDNEREINRLKNDFQKSDPARQALLKQRIDFLTKQNEEMKMLPFWEKISGTKVQNIFRRIVQKIVQKINPSAREEYRINPVASSQYAYGRSDYIGKRVEIKAKNTYEELRAQDKNNLKKENLLTTEDLDKALNEMNKQEKEKEASKNERNDRENEDRDER